MFFLLRHIKWPTLVANMPLCFPQFLQVWRIPSLFLFANALLAIYELFSLMDLRAADSEAWACTGQLAQALHSLYYLIKKHLF